MNEFTKAVRQKQPPARVFSVNGIAQIGMLSGIAFILMLIEFPLWFAPGFYKLDLSELPVLLGGFALGPAAGVLIELFKILLNLAFNGTATNGVGEFANLLIGCALVLPASAVYKSHKTKKNAVIGLACGTLMMTVAGSLLNAYMLLPMYSAVFHMPMEALVAMGSAVNPAINNVSTFVLLAVAPFNLFKGVLVSVITMIVYKKLSPALHGLFGGR